MDDLKQLREVVLEHAVTLADMRFKQVLWEEARQFTSTLIWLR